jgi:hypothetical protein
LYALLNWSKARARNGFLVSIAGALIVFASLYGGAARDLPFRQVQNMAAAMPTALPADDPLPNEAAANAVVLPSREEFDPLIDERLGDPAPPLSPGSDKPVLRVGPTRDYAYYKLSPAHIGGSVGKRLKIVTRAGKIKEGVLVGSGPKTLLLEIPRGNGRAAFEYRLRDLMTIYVYSHEPPGANTEMLYSAGGELIGAESLSQSPSNELELENHMPDAVLDLPVWAIPDAEDSPRRIREELEGDL